MWLVCQEKKGRRGRDVEPKPGTAAHNRSACPSKLARLELCSCQKGTVPSYVDQLG